MAWRLEEHSSEHRLRCRYSIYDDMRPVAYAFELSEARKLAAAPAMLEALKAVKAWASPSGYVDPAKSTELFAKAMDDVDTALAAAEPETGKQQPTAEDWAKTADVLIAEIQKCETCVAVVDWREAASNRVNALPKVQKERVTSVYFEHEKKLRHARELRHGVRW